MLGLDAVDDGGEDPGEKNPFSILTSRFLTFLPKSGFYPKSGNGFPRFLVVLSLDTWFASTDDQLIVLTQFDDGGEDLGEKIHSAYSQVDFNFPVKKWVLPQKR